MHYGKAWRGQVQGALISEGPKTFDGVFAECCTRCRALGNKDSASVKPWHSAAVSQVPCNTRRTFSEKIINKLPDRSHPVGRVCSLVSSPLWCPKSHAVAGAPGSCAAAGCRGCAVVDVVTTPALVVVLPPTAAPGGRTAADARIHWRTGPGGHTTADGRMPLPRQLWWPCRHPRLPPVAAPPLAAAPSGCTSIEPAAHMRERRES